MRFYGALIYTDFLLLESIRAVQAQILSEYNPKPCDNTRLKEIRSIRSIRVRLTSEFFRTLIYRIDADYFLRPYGAGYTPARDNPQIVHRVMVIRKDQSAVKAHINSHKNKISEEQIRRIGVIRD